MSYSSTSGARIVASAQKYWLQRWFEDLTSRKSRKRPKRRSYRPMIDILEDRFVPATVLFWTGGGDNDLWSTADNWLREGDGAKVVPGGGEELVFHTGGLGVDPTSTNSINDLAHNIFFEKITFQDEGDLDFSFSESQDGDDHGIQIGAGGIVNNGFGDNHTINLPVNVLSSGLNIQSGILSDVTLGAAITGNGTLTYSGFSNLVLSADNSSFNGQIVVDKGILVVKHSNALGAGGSLANGTIVNNTVPQDVGVELAGDGINVANEVLVLNGFEAELTSQGGTNSWGGEIRLGAGDFQRDIIVTNGQLTISGVISSTQDESGFPALSLRGQGILVFAGASSNTHAGVTRTSVSKLVLQKTGGAEAIVGQFAVNFPSTVVWKAGEQISDSAAISASTATILDLNGFNETVGPLTLFGANITTGAGTLKLNDDVTNQSGTSTISGKLDLGSANRVINVAGGTVDISADISGGDGFFLDKTGTGKLIFSGDNTYGASTRVLAGTLNVRSDSALGAGGAVQNETTVFKDGILELEGNIATSNEILVLGSNAGTASPVLRNVSGNNIWSGIVNLSSSSVIDVVSGTLAIKGDIAGISSNSLTKNGNGKLTLSGNNTFTGEVLVLDGTLSVQSNDALGDDFKGTTVASGATVELSGSNLNIASEVITLNGNGHGGVGALHNAAGNNVWAGDVGLNTDSSIGVAGGTNLNITGNISGAPTSDLTKVGDGNLILSTANDYDGHTHINQGIVTIRNGSALGPNGNPTTVANGATLVIDGKYSVTQETLNLSGHGTNGQGALVKLGSPFISSSTTWSRDVNLNGPTTISVGPNATLTLSGAVTGNGASTLTKVGDGMLRFSGSTSNTNLGQVNVSDGRLDLAKSGTAEAMQGNLVINNGEARYLSNSQLPDDTVVTVNSAGLLNMNGRSDLIDELAINGGNVTIGTGSLVLGDKLTSNNAAGTPSVVSATGGSLSFLSTSTRTATVIDGPSEVDLTFRGIATPLIKDGAGRLVVETPFSQGGSGSNVKAGVIRYVNTEGALGNIGATTVDDGAAIELSGGFNLPASFGPILTGSGIGGTGALRSLDGNNVIGGLTLNANTTIGVDAGTLTVNGRTVPGVGVAGATNLTKVGNGTFVMGNYQLKTGSVFTINNGTVLVNGIPENGVPTMPVIVNSGGTLGGTGEVGAVSAGPGSTVSPGVSPGILTANGNVVLAAASTFRVEINGKTAGSQFDQLKLPTVGQNVTINGARLDATLGFQSEVFDEFKIIDVAGRTPNLNIGRFAQGDEIILVDPVTGKDLKYLILYNAGDGNDVVLKHDNTKPTFINRSVTTPISEGQTVTLKGTIVDPDPLDTFFLTVDWGDGVVKTFEFAGADGETVNITHTYEDENDDDRYVIKLSWADDHEFSNSAELAVVVHNVAPKVDAGGADVVCEGSQFVRRGSFTDPGADTWTATVDYGDGSGEQPLELHHDKTFKLKHRYDEPGRYLVTVTVRDDDGGVGTDSFCVLVLPRGSQINQAVCDAFFAWLAGESRRQNE